MRKSIIFLLLISLTRFASSQDDSQSRPSPLIDLVLPLEDGRLLLKQLNELEFRRSEVFALLDEIKQAKAENAALVGELRKQLDLEKEAHGLTRRDLALASERADFYARAYQDLKKPPPSKAMSRAVKWGLVVGIAVAGAAVAGYVVSR